MPTPQSPAPKKVHITLVGAQVLPVYNVIIATKPDVVEFVYSDKTKSVMERVAAEISPEIAASQPLSATDLDEIISRAKHLAQKYADCDVTLNISGGSKPWSHFFSEAFANHPHCSVLYIDQNNTMYDFTSLKSRKLNLPIDIERNVRLHGTPIASHRLLSDYTTADTAAIADIERLHRLSVVHKTFNHLFAQNKEGLYEKIKNAPDGKVSDPYGFWAVEWHTYDENGADRTAINITLHNRNNLAKVYHCNIDSHNAPNLLFNSGWYEYKVAMALIGWSKAKDLWLNCKFLTKDNQKEDKNEVDIILTTDTKLIFVECKTQIHKITDIDKLHAEIKNYGGMSSKGLCVTLHQKKSAAAEKCRDHGIADIIYNNTTDEKDLHNKLNNILKELNSR